MLAFVAPSSGYLQGTASKSAALHQAAMSDVSELQEQGKRHGFDASTRKSAWQKLLSHVHVPEDTTNALNESDERTIRMDAKRSFGAFLEKSEVPAAQERLERVLLGGMRRAHPRSRYIQGLHDVATVLLLAMEGDDAAAEDLLARLLRTYMRDLTVENLPSPRESIDSLPSVAQGQDAPMDDEGDATTAGERESLNGEPAIVEESASEFEGAPSGFELVVHRLDNLHPLVWECDPALGEALMNSQVRPVYALSWVMTWFAHDLTDLQAAYRLYDLFMASHPAMPLYLAACHLTAHRDLILHAAERDKNERKKWEAELSHARSIKAMAVGGAAMAYLAATFRVLERPSEAWQRVVNMWNTSRHHKSRLGGAGSIVLVGVLCWWIVTATKKYRRGKTQITEPRDAPELYSRIRNLPTMTVEEAHKRALEAVGLFERVPVMQLPSESWHRTTR